MLKKMSKYSGESADLICYLQTNAYCKVKNCSALPDLWKSSSSYDFVLSERKKYLL